MLALSLGHMNFQKVKSTVVDTVTVTQRLAKQSKWYELAREAPATMHVTLHQSLPKLPKSDGSRIINSVEGLEVLSSQREEKGTFPQSNPWFKIQSMGLCDSSSEGTVRGCPDVVPGLGPVAYEHLLETVLHSPWRCVAIASP